MPRELSRLGIFVFYDRDGVVDRYVIRLLTALRPNFKKLVVISNIHLEDRQADALKEHCDALFMRENKGLDAAAYKKGLVTYCGWDEVEQYDEVVLINDTFFGPVHSFDEMFEQMSEKDLDFWGMSAGYCQPDGWKWSMYGYIPAHIQTFFVAFRQNMVKSKAFHDYWDNYDENLTTFQEVVSRHEMIMTKHFEDLGFRWDVYAEAGQYRSDVRTENFNMYFYHATGMMKDMKFPVIKKKIFSKDLADNFYMCDLEDAADAMAYIRSHSDYDTGMIWENILRLYNVTDIYESLHMNYVLPSVMASAETMEKAALVFYVSNPFFVKQFCQKAQELAEAMAVYMIPATEEIGKSIKAQLGEESKVYLETQYARPTEMGTMLRCFGSLAQRYPYLGFVHDLQNPDHWPATVTDSAVYGFLQNAANDPAYISQVLNCFEENPHIGVLGTPFPLHHHGFGDYTHGWENWYREAASLSRNLKLRCNLTKDKHPLMTTGVFWCRSAALKPLWQKAWTTAQFKVDPMSRKCSLNEAIARLLPYVAQSEGYASGLVMHTNYASMRLTDQEFMLRDIVGTTRDMMKLTSDCYGGYMEQLQHYRVGEPDGRLVVDVSSLGLRTLILIAMDRYLPKSISACLFKIYRFVNRIFKK